MLRAFWKDQSGVTAIEYAFLAGFVSTVILVPLLTVGSSLDIGFTFVNDQMSAAVSDPVNTDQNVTPLEPNVTDTNLSMVR